MYISINTSKVENTKVQMRKEGAVRKSRDVKQYCTCITPTTYNTMQPIARQVSSTKPLHFC